MARTKQEVRDFLKNLDGQSVNAASGKYRGQCVSLIKALFEFLGVPNPYAARGHAKDAGNNYVKQGIAKSGQGWLNVCVNPTMGRIDGVNYGHIWLDLANEQNFEQNGAKALRTTVGTRPISQAQQFVNLDQWVAPDPVPPAPVEPPVVTPPVDNSPKIGDRVKTNATKDAGNGKNLNLAIINDGNSVWTETNSKGNAVLRKGGVVRCQVPVNSLYKA